MRINSKIVFNIIPFVLLCVFTANVYPQYKSLQLDHLTTDNGLSQSTITCICQDNQGFMWFGTYDGLNKYDGYKFTIYRHLPDDSSSLSDNVIWAILEDNNGDLWIGTRDGLNLYNRDLDNFKHFKHRDDDASSIGGNFIRALAEDQDGNIWIGTNSSGLNLLDASTGHFIRFWHNPEDTNSLSDNDINSLFVDSQNRLWIGTRNGYLDVMYSGKKIVEHIRINNVPFSNYAIRSFSENKDGYIWVGTQGQGLYRIRHQENQPAKIIRSLNSPYNKNTVSSDIILSTMFDSKGNLWIGTEDAGLNCYVPETGMFSRFVPNRYDNRSLSHQSVWSLFEDITGNIWIGTFAGGINLLPRYNTFFRHFKHFPGNQSSLSDNTVSMFFEDSFHGLWVATDGGGLNLFDRKNETFIRYTTKNSSLTSDAVLSIFEDSRENLWIGTWLGGLNEIKRNSEAFAVYTAEKNNLGSNNIFGMLEDRNGGLWVCTFMGGLSYFDPKRQRATVYNMTNSAISDDNVNGIIKDYSGNLWITAETGLNYLDLDTRTFTVYQYEENNDSNLCKGNLLSVFQAIDSTLWVGTTGGLNKFNRKTKSFTRYYTENGLPSNAIKGIVEDDHGNLWLSTNNGISRFDPKANTFKNFDVSDGLQGNEFYWHSIFKTSDGEIFVGGVNGFNVFHPDSIHSNPYVPPVVITDFRLFNKPVKINAPGSPLSRSISQTDHITLTYKQSVFSFDFTALNFISPMKNQYAYMLEGFEPNWNYVGTQRNATYTNLDAGDYTFRVKGSNNDGVWNEKGTFINITVEPPFWKTWWAYLLYVLSGLSIIYMIMRHFIGRERLKNALKLEHLELEKMYELDQMKSRFFTNVSHEFRTPITLIMGPLEPIISNNMIHPNVKKKLQLIYRNARRLLRMTNQLMDFHKIEAGELLLELSQGNIIQFVRETTLSFKDYARAHKIDFSIESDMENYFAWFDPDKVDKIIYNLLSNAFKFTQDGGRIKVYIGILPKEDVNESLYETTENLAEQYIQIMIRDNGAGIPGYKLEHIFNRFYQADDDTRHKYQGSGVGLALVYELINLYRGNIHVDSTEGEGSTFTVELPLDINYLEKHQLVREFIGKPLDHPDLFEDDVLETAISLAAPPVIEESDNDAAGTKSLPSILVIDDDQDIRSFIYDDFNTQFRLYEAQNGLIGYQKAIEFIPDVIITDIMMPVMNGTELCAKLKSDERTSHIPVILLTARSSDEHRIRGLQYGADAYITKPFNMEVLKAHIDNLLSSRKKLKERYSAAFLVGDNNFNSENIDEKFLNRAVNIVKEHLPDPNFNADMLSKQIGMSRMQLYRKFRGLTDQTVHEFIRSIRLKAAAQLLLKKRVTVTEVAYEVGFNDLTYFARCFRQQFGVSPSQYMSQEKQ
ncbi:response regulator [candidate division KSB1 bacterium]|nr:response regulator [candidate division KSB1 bacterium]